MYQEILKKLHSLEEEKYRIFSQKLLPSIEDIRGIRLPHLQKLAKEISKGDLEEYFPEVRHSFFEETMLMGLVIGRMELKKYTIEDILARVKLFIPYINNWSTCDSFCSSLKVTKKVPDGMFDFIKAYAVEEGELTTQLNEVHREYELRFFIVMCLDYFIQDAYIAEVMEHLKQIRCNHYYVNMALAWAYSKIYVNYPEIIMNQLMEMQSKDHVSMNEIFVHNKTISKICDSFLVSLDEKTYLRTLFIK